MKRTITIISLIVAILFSIISGTLALYTITLPNIAEGSVIAKNFVLIGEGSQNSPQTSRLLPAKLRMGFHNQKLRRYRYYRNRHEN